MTIQANYCGDDETLVVTINDLHLIYAGNDFHNFMRWMFKNIKGRFCMLHEGHIYFENKEDLLTFKLKYG